MKHLLPLLLAGSLATALPAFAGDNLLVNASPADWGGAGATPPKPWQHSDRGGDVTVRALEHEGALWIELRDDSTEKPANLRQEFAPLRAGRLSFRVALAKDHVGDFGIYLGQGNVTAPVERVVELKSSGRGVLVLGSAGQRVPTSLTLAAGMNDRLFLEFRPAGHDLQLRLGRVAVDGTEITLGDMTAPQQAHPVTRLRITTDNQPKGSRVLVTDLVLSSLD
jgi:hypothetical protein